MSLATLPGTVARNISDTRISTDILRSFGLGGYFWSTVAGQAYVDPTTGFTCIRDRWSRADLIGNGIVNFEAAGHRPTTFLEATPSPYFGRDIPSGGATRYSVLVSGADANDYAECFGGSVGDVANVLGIRPIMNTRPAVIQGSTVIRRFETLPATASRDGSPFTLALVVDYAAKVIAMAKNGGPFDVADAALHAVPLANITSQTWNVRVGAMAGNNRMTGQCHDTLFMPGVDIREHPAFVAAYTGYRSRAWGACLMPHNVLFICSDDLAHVGRMMQVLVRGFDLPNLRRLADTGTDFDRAYCVVPVCEPARCAMMTGLSPADTKSFDLSVGWQQIVHPRNLWSYRLREEGYWMGTTGKIFHGYNAQPASVYAELYDDEPFTTGAWQPGSAVGEDMGGMYGMVYDDDVNWYDVKRADDAIDAIQNKVPTDRPWYYELGFHHPHNGWYTPRRVHEQINLNDVILPEDWQGGFDTLPFVEEFIRTSTLGFGSSDPALWNAEQTLYVRRTIHNYAAGCLWMDEQLGRVLDALEASPHADNTVVTFYSDHGYHMSDHAAWHKFTLYEQAALAPMLIRVPGQTPRKVESPVSHIDLGVTILDLCGLPVPQGHRGTSLRPWIEGQTSAPRPIPTFWYGSCSVAIGTKRTTVYQDGSAEMFDLVADPWARRNIATTDPDFTAHREIAAQTAQDWHMMLVEEAIDTSHPSNLQSFIGTSVTDARFSTSFVALGDLHSKGRSPGWQRMYSNQLNGNPSVRMPPHIEDFGVMGFNAQPMDLTGNDLPNRVTMAGIFGKRVQIDFGDGDDENRSPENTSVVLYGRNGNDLLRAGARQGNQLFGGPGHDTLMGNSAADLLEGGTGNDSISGGAGNDTLIAGPGNDTLLGGGDDDLLIVDAGSGILWGDAGADTFRIHRTGEISYIRDLTATDTLDLTEWSVIAPVTAVQSGADVHVRAGLELLICNGTTVANVVARTTGVTINAA